MISTILPIDKQTVLFQEPSLHVLVAFHKNEKGQLTGIIKTLLPSTIYEFSVYALNSTGMNMPSEYSLPVKTPDLKERSIFSFGAFGCSGNTPAITNRSKFGRCTIQISYEERKQGMID